MKKRVLAIFMAALMVGSLTACGGSSSGGDDASADSGSTDTSTESGSSGGSGDTIEVAIWDNNQLAGIQEICDLFTEETGIKVEVSVTEWDSYWTLLEAGASGGDMPDVFWMHSNNSQMYMNNDILLKLDDYIESSDKINMDNYMPEVTELYTWNDSYYAIPKDYDTIALCYNKTMFDEAGLDYPDETWTWDDMYDAAVKLTKDDGSQYGFCMNPSNDQDTYYNMVYANDGYIVSEDHKTSGYDDPKTLEAMEYVAKLLENACPPAATMSETGTDVMFQSGNVAMITQGSWMLPGFKENEYFTENCDFAILPYNATTGKRVSIVNGLGWAASANTDKPDECWQLLEWLGSEEMQVKQAELGVTMSAYNGTSDTWVNSADFNLAAFLDMTEEKVGDATNELVLRPYTYNSTVWSTAAQTALTKAWEDPSTMTQVCTDFAAEMNSNIAAENSN